MRVCVRVLDEGMEGWTGVVKLSGLLCCLAYEEIALYLCVCFDGGKSGRGALYRPPLLWWQMHETCVDFAVILTGPLWAP